MILPRRNRPTVVRNLNKAQLLRPSLLDIERILSDIDEVAETLIEQGAVSRALFRKIGGALSGIGDTVQGVKPAVKMVGDKYTKSQKPKPP